MSDSAMVEREANQDPLAQKLEKKIPGAPDNETPVHLRRRQIFSHNLSSLREPEEAPKEKAA